MRSNHRAAKAAVNSGKAISTSSDVTSMFQVKIGIRNIVMPGARSVTIVVIMLTAARMVPRPEMIKPMIQRSAPTDGVFNLSFNGE